MALNLRDEFNRDWLEKLTGRLHSLLPQLEPRVFQQAILQAPWETLALKQRMTRVALVLADFLPNDFQRAMPLLEAIAADFKGLTHLPFIEYVALSGLETPELSLPLLARLTENSSAEFAVRHFIRQDSRASGCGTLNQMYQWALSENPHVRRLASEGCRPRLPWSYVLQEFTLNPAPLRPILESLKQDSSPYVRKSVANNLNDISKDHPLWVLALCEQWAGLSAETDWIIKHGLRTLLKQGNPQALALIGYEKPHPDILIEWDCDPQVCLGDKLYFKTRLDLSEMQQQQVRLEYALYFVRKNLPPYRKVFKMGEFIASQPLKNVLKFHDFKAISTRTYSVGTHRIELLINGIQHAQTTFEVVE